MYWIGALVGLSSLCIFCNAMMHNQCQCSMDLGNMVAKNVQ